VGRKTLHVGGEALLEGDPDYTIYADYITHWEDGTPLSEDEKAAILDDVVAEAARRGWKFEISW
jgi:hypothetical protein